MYLVVVRSCGVDFVVAGSIFEGEIFLDMGCGTW
jgi:hypothetical protein